MNAVAPRERGYDGGGVDGGDEPPVKAPRAVFVSDFVHVAQPYGKIAPKLLDPEAMWLRRLSEKSPSSRFVVTAGEPRELNQMTTVPIEWTPTAYERLLPSLEADLQLSHLDGSFCRLGISGRYRPPLASLGLTIDRLALHRVAESSLRRFLLGVEEALTADP